MLQIGEEEVFLVDLKKAVVRAMLEDSSSFTKKTIKRQFEEALKSSKRAVVNGENVRLKR